MIPLESLYQIASLDLKIKIVQAKGEKDVRLNSIWSDQRPRRIEMRTQSDVKHR